MTNIIIYHQITDTDIKIQDIFHFFKTLNTRDMNRNNVKKLVNSGFDSIYKIITASNNDLLSVHGFGKKTADFLEISIKDSLSTCTLIKFILASNRNFNISHINKLLAIYPNLINESELLNNEEFKKELNKIVYDTSLFISNLRKFIDFYITIKDYIDIENKTMELKDIIFVFSGFRDKNLQNYIESYGGKVGQSLIKNTKYVVVKDQCIINNPTTKIKQAIDLNIKIIVYDELINMLDSKNFNILIN